MHPMQPDDSIASDLFPVDTPKPVTSVPSPTPATVPSFPVTGTPAPAVPQPAAPMTQLPPTFRNIGDIDKTRQLIFDNLLNTAKGLQPVSNTRHSMHIENVGWQGPDRYSVAEQKKAILSRSTLGRRLTGDVVLRDLTGAEIGRRKTQLARVPYMTDRGTFIIGGNEYTMSHQLRLRPGVFTRVKQNGELESHVNVAKGYSHRIELDPATGIFKVNIGQAHIQLLPLLKAMGVPETKIREAWGNELTAANMQKEDTQAIRKLHEKLFRNKEPGEEGASQSVVKAFNDMVLDPEVTKRTLGQGFSNVNADALLAITNKLLRVSRHEEEPDDRDAMAYQTMVGPEDVFSERLQKAKTALRQAFWKVSGRGNLDGLQSNMFNDAIHAALMTSGLGQPLSEINPAEIFDQHARVTRMGEGGITSMDAVPDECYDDETEVFTSKGWVPWPRTNVATEFACLIDGRLEYHRPYRVIHQLYDGQMYGITTRTLDCLVTAGHRHWVRKYRSTSSVQRCGEAAWGYELASTVHRRPRQFMVSHLPFHGATAVERITLPHVDGARHAFDFNANDWAELVGWYISEGSIDSYALRVRKKYCVTISQDSGANPENVQRIALLLTRMGIAHSYQGKNFVFVSKQLGVWFAKNCGVKCANKMIPEECFFWSNTARERLLDGLVAGDGSLRDNGSGVYTSKSQRLVDQVARLAVTLGIAASNRRAYTRIDKRPDRSNEPTTGCTCGLLISQTQGVTSERMYADSYYTCQYNGYVHCAEVPGGLLFVRRRGSLGMWSGNSRAVQPSQFGFIDFLRTPESGKVGVDARIARATVKGDNGQLYTRVRTPDGQYVYKTPQEFADATVAFPTELKSPEAYVHVLQKGQFKTVPREQVDFEVPEIEDTFSPLGNMIPFKSALKGQRAVMAARMMTQALPLRGAEAPLVQNGIPGKDNTSFEQEYAKHMGAVHADQPARVVDVSNESMTLIGADGKKKVIDLYHNFPFNQKTFLHQTPMVKPGDIVKPGQLLARSNFTDQEGTTALGLNARVAYIPWDGLNFEDANVVSESFAKRMSSEHMYQNVHEWEGSDKKGLNAFRSIFPADYDKATLSKFDEHGVIKPGSRVKQGDPLILIARAREVNKKSMIRGGKPTYQNMSQTWDNSDEGVVTDVMHTPSGVSVVVKATVPMQVGDKISGRFGDKGVIAKIIPDDQMPTDKDGKPFEALLNPLGITSRTNPVQIMEAALGRVAALTGKPYRLPDGMSEGDLAAFALKEIQKHGLEDTIDVTDPRNGRKIPGVFTGNRWLMKLHHTSESKAQGRGLGAYTAEGTPAKGGAEGAKRIGMLETNALLSHGATKFTRNSSLIRGQSSPQAWAQYMSGHKMPVTAVPHVYHKYVNNLRASGINVVRQGSKLNVMALTDKDIDELAGDRQIQNTETVDWKTMEPIKGGLFDTTLTGGHATGEGGGNRWSFIKLHEPMPNPVMEEPIRRVLGITTNKFNDILSGKEKLLNKTGPGAIAAALQQIDVEKEIARAREDIRSGKRTARDAAIRRLNYLKSAQRLNIHPKDWMLSRVPVLPPAFRPVSTMGANKLPLVADANYLYKEMFDANRSLQDLAKHLDPDDLGDERMAVYNAFKAVTGLGDPTHVKNQERGVKGILKHVFGSSPKLGAVQRRLLGSSTDLVGRAVIAPDPDLDMDQVGLPENQAWTIYTPILVHKLVRKGMPKLQAVRSVEERSEAARKELLDEMDNGVVVINRAPTLHRYGMMAARPRLVKGDVLKISPLVVSGFGADFDGDAMQYHVPIGDDERQEVMEKMLPSKNLLSAATFQAHYLPSQEYVGGLYEATSNVDTKNRPLVFNTAREAIAAYRRGEIGVGRQVHIVNH